MAEERESKTEAPTPRRRSEARGQGNVAKSQDLTAAITLLGAMIVLNVIAGPMLAALVRMTRIALGDTDASMTTLDGLGALMGLVGHTFLKTTVPMMLAVFVIGVLACLMQVGWLFTLKPLTPQLSKLNPINGLGRLLSMRSLFKAFVSICKMGLAFWVAWLTIRQHLDRIVFAMGMDHVHMIMMAGGLVFTLSLRLGLLLLVLAILDYAYQRHRHEQDLKMTKQEVKDELKRMEGDPQIKQKRRQMQVQMAIHRIRREVPGADVVVTNPTHVAVALTYDQATMAAPRLVAKGADLLALQIRRLAEEHDVPIVERPALARAIYADVEVGREIPPKFYQAVAEILAYVYELSGMAGRQRAALSPG